ncbi:competence protein CoiA family protein [Staphylococcus nepalensis]|uniref:competence protein CoiA n=1 Tax=Staphylococcus nepalensis TaxID=214473 RepID=UPI002270815B|nr:competence protein CoiA family protein [Staphylococcus nepalensis]MCY1037585.1 competence protein CoiA family protein [Staphylococcus nepalensis]
MLYARNSQNQNVWAGSALKGDQYRCPFCNCEVLLKNGQIITPHFAHYKRNHLYCQKSETHEHYYLKYCIAQKLKKLNYKVSIEPYIPDSYQYPDLIIDDAIVIEIQFSSEVVAHIVRRSRSLQNIGYKVIWIIKNVKYNIKTCVLYLSNYERNFINSHNRLLFSWDAIHDKFYVYRIVYFLGGQRFIAKRYLLEIDDLINFIQSAETFQCPTQSIKLTRKSIYHYINQCRKARSVLEPSLSIMYNLRLTDEWVSRYLGIVFPEQIFIKSHPIYWQLQLMYFLRNHTLQIGAFQSLLKFNRFYNEDIDTMQITYNVVQSFKQFYGIHGCYSVQN